MDTYFNDPLFVQSLGKRIIHVDLSDTVLNLRFSDGCGIALVGQEIHGDGQNCYMTCDDDLNTLIGSTLVNGMLRAVTLGLSEINFLEIQSTHGCITVENHNDHNGSYYGLSLQVSTLDNISAHQLAALLSNLPMA